jgi:hypothetical protein
MVSPALLLPPFAQRNACNKPGKHYRQVTLRLRILAITLSCGGNIKVAT